MTYSLKISCLGVAALAVSGCTIPNYDVPAQVQLKAPVVAPVVKKPAAPAPVQAQAPAAVPEEVLPKKPWAHVPIGNSGNSSDGGSGGLSDGDEDGGWG